MRSYLRAKIKVRSSKGEMYYYDVGPEELKKLKRKHPDAKFEVEKEIDWGRYRGRKCPEKKMMKKLLKKVI